MKPTIDNIDDLLPQTQCGLCDYDGCRPYATAIVEKNEVINRCPPGGIETLLALAQQLSRDPTPFLHDMQQKAKPASRAVIREDECIGCTKCIQACPTDAILGASKKMHTVIGDACTGCELCVAPCPVDCIDMMVVETPSSSQRQQQSKRWRQRHLQRNVRLARLKRIKKFEQSEMKQPFISNENQESRKLAVLAAVQRARTKRTSHE